MKNLILISIAVLLSACGKQVEKTYVDNAPMTCEVYDIQVAYNCYEVETGKTTCSHIYLADGSVITDQTTSMEDLDALLYQCENGGLLQ